MTRVSLSLLLVLFAAAAYAQQDQSGAAAMPRDEKTEQVVSDLRALGRIPELTDDLGRSRQVMLAIADSDIELLRDPRGDGTYRWATLQREEGGRVRDEKTIEHVSTEKELRYVTVTGPNGYRVEVTVRHGSGGRSPRTTGSGSGTSSSSRRASTGRSASTRSRSTPG
jgi:beta-glucosidase/6-phospho-beta-glucosidase/beta-galactosidase